MSQYYINRIRRMITDVGIAPDAYTAVAYTIPTQDDEYTLDVYDDVTITLPAVSVSHPLINIRNLIKDTANDTITVSPASGEKINGVTDGSITFSGEYNTAQFIPNTAGDSWNYVLSNTREDNSFSAELFFADDTITEALEFNSTYVSQHWLRDISPDNNPPASPYTGFFAYQAIVGNWCTDNTTIYDSDHNVVTPDDIDYVNGLFMFNSKQSKDIYIRGRTFDMYNCAAQLLLRWANSLKLDYSYSSVAGNFSRLERIDALMNLYTHYKEEARMHSLPSQLDFRNKYWYRYSSGYWGGW